MKNSYIIILLCLVIIFILIRNTKTPETFTPRLRSIYRPYIRHFNTKYDNFINQYGPQFIWNKVRKWNIY
jgi:hypothetical protein